MILYPVFWSIISFTATYETPPMNGMIEVVIVEVQDRLPLLYLLPFFNTTRRNLLTISYLFSLALIIELQFMQVYT